MKITQVESFILHIPIPRLVTDSFNQGLTWGLPGAIIHTDEGITGTGFTSTLTHGDHAIKDVIDRIYTPKLTGADPLCTQRLWRELYWSDAHWVGRLGITQMALAAIDMALWDIKAKGVRCPAVEARRRRQGRPRAFLQHRRWMAELRDPETHRRDEGHHRQGLARREDEGRLA